MCIRLALVTLFIAITSTGCGDDDRPAPADAGDAGGGDGAVDPCMGRALCDAAGASCVGDEVVTCAEDADGCLVETRTDCGATGDVCDASGAAPACVDPCSMIPEADRCDTDGARACTGETLEVCTMDADGCLVLERTQCDASPGGVCDAGGDMPVCALPPDPCASIPAADRCDTEGTSCDADELVSCAPNAFGCLVVTRTDCTSRAGGACDATGAAAICTATDPCAGLDTCDAEGTRCDGPELVSCAPDAFGCLVETTTDCTGTMFGFCDEGAAPSAMCSTAAVDPCMGVTECGTEPSRECSDRMTLSICAANAFGCFVATATDCTATSEVCDATSGTAMCVDACSLVTVCPSASYCAGDDLVACAADADGCLVESSRTTCADTCDAVSGSSACVTTACPGAAPGFIDCSSGTVSGDTAMGTMATDGPYGSCYSGTNYPGREQYWRFRHSGTEPVEVQIVSTRGSSSADFDLFVLDGGDGTATCTSGLACLDSGRGTSATETVEFLAEPGETDYVVYDLYDSTGTATTDYTLSITCTPIVCGDGNVQAGEECDDGGTAAGDGCSATCTIETGYSCAGEPSACTPLAANATCATATAITSDTTITGENPFIGGPRPTGSGCNPTSGSGTTALYYEVTIPAATEVEVQTTPGSLDIVLLTMDSCSATSCASRTDSSPERAMLTNLTSSPITRIVVVHNWSATASGTYDISFTYSAASGAPNATCATATPITTDTIITGENPLDGGPRPSGTGCSPTTGTGTTALYYAVTVPANTYVAVQTTPGRDIVLLTQDVCGGACTSRTDSSPESAALVNDTASPVTRIVVVHNYSSGGSGTYDIAFTYRSFPTNTTCGAATPITGDTTITGENPLLGGPRPSGTGCSPTTGSGTTALYYEVTVPANSRVAVQTTPGLDIVLLTMDSCAAGTCTSRTDTSPERARLDNPTGSPVTRIVVVHNYYSTGSGAYNISFTYSALPYSIISAACVAGGTWSSLTRSGTSDDASTPISPLPFAFTYFGDAVTHFSTNTNGMAQLWPSSSGTPSTAFSNSVLPSTSTPNGIVAPFWDDLYLGTGFDIRTQTVGSAGSQVFVIEWNDALAGSGGAPVTFQAHFYEGTNVIEFHYCSVGGSTRASGDSATIGAENLGGTEGFTISYNRAGAIATGTGYRIAP